MYLENEKHKQKAFKTWLAQQDILQLSFYYDTVKTILELIITFCLVLAIFIVPSPETSTKQFLICFIIYFSLSAFTIDMPKVAIYGKFGKEES